MTYLVRSQYLSQLIVCALNPVLHCSRQHNAFRSKGNFHTSLVQYIPQTSRVNVVIFEIMQFVSVAVRVVPPSCIHSFSNVSLIDQCFSVANAKLKTNTISIKSRPIIYPVMYSRQRESPHTPYTIHDIGHVLLCVCC